MRGILKNTLLLLGGMALGSLATRRAIRYAVENRYDGVEIVQTDDGYIITLPQPKPITYKEEP